MRKLLIGPEADSHWIISGVPLGIQVGSNYRKMLDTNSTHIFVCGAGDPSSDGNIVKLNKYGVIEWGKALTETLVVGPPRVGQFTGNSVVADDTYVTALHDMEDDNYSVEYRGVIHSRTVSNGTLNFQRQFVNGTANCIDTDGTYVYCLGAWDSVNYCCFWRTNLSTGTSSNQTRFSTGGKGRDIAVGSTYVYSLVSDASSPYTSDYLVQTNTSGTIQRDIPLGTSVDITSTSGCIQADSSDNCFLAAVDSSGVLYIVKLSSTFGTTWQKKITRSGWTFSSPQCLLDSDGNVFVSFLAFDGGSVYRTGIVKLNSSGAELDQLTISETSAPTSGITALRELGTDLVFLQGLNYLVKYPKDFSKVSTYGTFSFSSGSDWTVSTSTLSLSTGSLANASDSITISSSSFGDSDTTSSYTLTKTDIR